MDLSSYIFLSFSLRTYSVMLLEEIFPADRHQVDANFGVSVGGFSHQTTFFSKSAFAIAVDRRVIGTQDSKIDPAQI